MKLIDRFIIRQLTPLFLLGILAFTGLILGVGGIYKIIRLAIDYNADISFVLFAFVFKLPEIITYTLPMSTLFSIIITFNQMSSDLEITALRAGGVSFIRLLIPAVVFAYCVSIAALFMGDRLVPAANGRFNTMVAKIQGEGKLENRDFNIIDDNKGTKRIFFISEIKGRRLSGITLQEFENGEPARFIIARSGRIENGNRLILSDIETVMFYRKQPGGHNRHTVVKTPDTMEIPFKHSAGSMALGQKKNDELTIRDLRARLREMARQGADPSLTRKVAVDMHSKLSIPFASLAFALIAAPLALRPNRASSSIGLGISVIIIFLYYIFQQMFRGLGMQIISPIAAAWLPDCMLVAVGAWLCSKANK